MWGVGLRDELTDQELLRYSRQIMMPDFDMAGQLALVNARVLIVGLGGLGAPVAMYLAAAGVGHLTLVDDDVVEVSNLQRQIIHHEASVGLSKVASAAQTLKALNSTVTVIPVCERLTAERMQKLVAGVDLVLDCTDNFRTRFALNQACSSSRKPLVSGAAIRSEGQVTVFDPRDTDSPCYRCLYPELEEAEMTCSMSGVLAPLVGIIGSVQALEAIKVLAGYGETLVGRVLLLDAKTMQWRSLKLKKDPGCTCAGLC